MLAIVAGLNMTPIRRLKRTWEQVPQRSMTMLSQCETMLNTNKNFGNYRHKLSTIVAPCVPFIGERFRGFRAGSPVLTNLQVSSSRS